MRIRTLPLILGFVVMVLAACMPMPLYNEAQTELERCRKQRDEALNELASLNVEHKQTVARYQTMQQQLSVSEAARSQLTRDLKRLEAQNAYLKNINQQQQTNINTLKLELEKRKSVIQLQGKVIQLLDDTKKTIETSLKDQIASQEIEVVEADDKLKVIFVDKILFDSGSVEINPRGKELLMIMAGSLKDSEDQNIVVEGHTDNVPLSEALRKRFPSNWELSTARAATVARFFQEAGGIPAEKLSARGYSFYRPVASNETAEGRHQNRRIEIILSPVKE
ncbi:MAG: OmpA family protein [Deltaproteobacteria bacterium]|jgi:chemotaxis protein MotB|nr:OmpA family protein [Deltaproteobacteria bacterium]MBW2482535.1 OmpA family protein [Deltaproteobacteria bacterium]